MVQVHSSCHARAEHFQLQRCLIQPGPTRPHSAWETPDPGFWTRLGYALVRADELGLGQSPGVLDTMSRGTSEAFFDVIEWAASRSWSSGKVGLVGISYYAGSQWRVAARRPNGLTCIIPWEGMSDYYRDRCRHGGIYSNTFIKFWWDRQVYLLFSGREENPTWPFSRLTLCVLGHHQSVWTSRKSCSEMGT